MGLGDLGFQLGFGVYLEGGRVLFGFLFVCVGFLWQANTSSDLSVDVSGGCMFFLCYYTRPLLSA